MQVADLTIDYDRRRVVRGDEEIRLTPKEFELLALLARNADRVLTHRAILKAIWGPNAVNQPEHLWVLVAQLRKKIEVGSGTAAVPGQRTVGRLPAVDRVKRVRSPDSPHRNGSCRPRVEDAGVVRLGLARDRAGARRARLRRVLHRRRRLVVARAPPAPWFVLAAVVLGAALRAADVEARALFVPGGLYGSVRETLGELAAKVGASALLVDRLAARAARGDGRRPLRGGARALLVGGA